MALNKGKEKSKEKKNEPWNIFLSMDRAIGTEEIKTFKK